MGLLNWHPDATHSTRLRVMWDATRVDGVKAPLQRKAGPIELHGFVKRFGEHPVVVSVSWGMGRAKTRDKPVGHEVSVVCTTLVQ